MLNRYFSFFTVALGLSCLPACHLAAGVSQVAKDSTPLSTSEKCTFLGDEYESKVLLPKGQHKGECVDTTSARSVILKESPNQKDSEFFTVANVGHEKTFWIAEIPKNGVEEVVFQMEKFPAPIPAAHTQLRLRFKEGSPVKLTHQIESGRTAQVRDIVLSVEAIGQKGWTYDLMRGMKDEYLTAYRIVSLRDKYNWMVVTQKHDVVQWPLKLSDQQKQAILPAFLAKATREGMNAIYNTITRSCTNELFRVMDSTLDYGALRMLPILLNPLDETYPVLVKSALTSRGLLSYVDNPAAYPPNRPLDKTTHVPSQFDVRWPMLADDPTVEGGR
ncbi:MAG: hypothetical protein RIR26_363 [Pseudomonadota bacterium]|jgi:hypothetical protein